VISVALMLALASPAPVPETAGALDTTAPPSVEPLVGPGGVSGLRARFLVRAAPAVVLETLWDVRRFRSIFPDIESLAVVATRGECSVDVRFVVNAVLAKVSYTLRRDLDRAAGTVVWRSIAGDLKSVRGSWTVRATEEPDVSQVVYTSFVDVGRLVPTGMVRDLALGKVKELASRVRAAVATPSTSAPPGNGTGR